MRTLDLLAAMRVFIRMVECGSISEAARHLGVGQSTLSERLDRLEKHLGLPLLYRHARTLLCTPEGQMFYERSKRAINAIETALAVGRERSEVRGICRISAPTAFGEIVLPAIIVEIRKRYPELNLELLLDDNAVDPATAGVDLALQITRTDTDVPERWHLGYLPRVLVASPAFLAERPPITEPSALQGQAFIRARDIYDSRVLELIDGNANAVQVPITSALTTSHWRPAREQLIAGLGFGVLQQRVCVDAFREGRLERVLPAYSVPSLQLHAVLPVNRMIPAKTQAVLCTLKECLPNQLENARA